MWRVVRGFRRADGNSCVSAEGHGSVVFPVLGRPGPSMAAPFLQKEEAARAVWAA